jgi:uncharacterized alkaline shock family protein YloU
MMTTDMTLRSGAPGSKVGRTELGMISINDRVVQKMAACAAVEIPDAGGAAPRLLGRSVSGAAAFGGRGTSLTSLPKVSADVDGSIAVLDLSISVRWPASVPEVSSAVREHVRSRVHELAGLTVTEVSISVTDLVTRLPAPPRVH